MAPRRPRFVLGVLASQALAAYGALPKVDFERMGKVGAAGPFAGIDLYNDDPSSQQQTTFDPTTSTLFLRAQDGGLTPIGSTNAGGSVVAGCSLGDVFYVGGSFTTLGGTNAANVAAYSSSTTKIAQLAGGGLDGPASALYCDQKNSLLWVGGSFHAPTTGDTAGFAGSIATYHPSSNTWSAPPFAGLSGGAVNAIVPTTDNSALLFGGSFVTSYQGNTTNITSVTNPNVPSSSGATTFSSSLVPFSLADAEIDPSPPSTLPGLGDITKILCPAGPDGVGNTWFAEEGFQAVLTIRTNKQLSASGLRLGNTFFDGQSTTTFKVTSLPDNTVLTLTYNNPGTDETEHCSNPCPLSTDSSVAYQDFIFDSPAITGLEVVLTGWNGNGPGLHLLQLLSDGSFASAVNGENGASCYAPGASSVQTTGSWTQQQVFTQIPATTQNVLVANVAAGSTSSVTWNIYTSASGQYEVYMWVPGCLNMEDCDARTTVDVTITPGGTLNQVTKTISQQVNADTRILVYTGPIIPPTPGFLVPVKMQLASSPQGTGVGGQYQLVADRVQFQLNSTNLNGNGNNGSSNSTGSSKRGFGLFEWPLNNSFGSINATGTLPNSTLSTFNVASQQLFSQVASAASSTIDAIAAYSSDTLFLAGKFALGNKATNIVAYKSNALAVLAHNGLNGAVSSLVLYGDSLFVGGNFEATADNSTTLRYIAEYSISGNTWSPLGGGVDGPVTSLNQENGRISVAGNFTHILTGSSTTGPSAAGFASWDIASKVWVNSGGLLVGDMTFVGNATANGQGEYVAGNVKTYRKYGADGMVSLDTDKSGQAVITPLGVKLDGVATTNTTNTNARRKRWSEILKRQTQDGTLPNAAPSPAPAVLAGAFWTNTTNMKQVIVLGGNFSIPSSDVDVALAIYDPDSDTIKGLEGAQVQGVVRELLVVGNKLFVGGEFTLKGVSGSGFAVYDLQSQAWVGAVPGLQASSGSVVVRSITSMPSQPNTVVVAGTFSSAGSTQCPGICALDLVNQSWSALGTNVQGEVSTVTYAGTNGNILLAAGALTIANKEAQVAMYSSTNQTWTAIGTLPGPVTALSANDLNQTSLFAAGKTSGNDTSFVSYWDGAHWTTLDVSLGPASNVTQLEFVPLSEEHDVQGIIQTNRMLWLSGSLSSQSAGSFSSALYDGKTLHPYLITSTASGDPGAIASFFHSFSTFSFDIKQYLARGVVILISIALGAGVVFLLGLIGVLWALFRRRDERNFVHDTFTDEKEYDNDVDSYQRPSSLLAHINAATRNTILMPKDMDVFANAGHKGEETTVDPIDQAHARSDSMSHEGTLGAGAGIALMSGTQSPVTTIDEDDVNRPAQARYSFEGNGEGELPLKIGQDVLVLNDQDSTWWYVRDKNTLREGIAPAAYLV